MSDLIGYAIILILLAMGVVECLRYRRANAGDSDQLPYPRRRLSRRLGVCLLFVVVVLTVNFFPEGGSGLIKLLILAALLLAICIGFLMLWRDLHETSVSVVNESLRLEVEASEAFAKLMDAEKSKRPKDNDSKPANHA